MRKTIFSTIVLAMLGVMPCLATTLRMVFTDGSVVTCNLAKEPKMTFGDKTLTLTTTDGAVGEWEFSNIDKWTFDATTGVEDAQQDAASINITDEAVTVSGNASQTVTVYDINGTIVATAKKQDDKACSIALSTLPKGAYILKAAGKTVKFVKQ